MRSWLQKTFGGGKFANPNNRLIQRLMRYQYLWHFGRQSSIKGITVGLFWAMQPMPFQMIPSALCAYLLRANLPLALACVWISNPITMAPMMFFNYFIGVYLLNMPLLPFGFSVLSLSDWWQVLQTVWQPLLLGSLVVGAISAALGFMLVNIIWRIAVMRKYKRRN